MKRFCGIIFVLGIFVQSTFAQELVLTPYGMRSSAYQMRSIVEYEYKAQFNKKDVLDFCKNNLAQPEFFDFRVDFSDDQIIKVSGYIKDNFKGETFSMLMEFTHHSVMISSELFDKKGKPLNCMEYFSKRGKVKDKKFKETVELRLNDFVKSVLGLRINIRE